MKKTIDSLRYISMACWAAITLTACQKPAAPTTAAVDDVKNAVPPVSTTDARLGFYTGRFAPSATTIALTKEFDKWIAKREREEVCDGRCSGGEINMSDAPAKLRSILYEHPLYGWEKNALAYVTPPTLVSLHLDEIKSDSTASAHVVTLGKEWQISGTWQKQGDVYTMTLSPDASAPVGVWQIAYDVKTQKIDGTWDGATSSAKQFSISAYDFKYEPQKSANEKDTDGWHLNGPFVSDPSLQLLTVDEAKALHKPEIRYLRNLIAARHGKAFANAEVRASFEVFSIFNKKEEGNWYVPVHQDVSDFTEIENKNLKLLQQYEPAASPDRQPYAG